MESNVFRDVFETVLVDPIRKLQILGQGFAIQSASYRSRS